MSLAQGGAAGLQTLEPLIIILAAVAVIWWRIVLRLVAIGLVVVLVSGLVLILQAMHHIR